MHSDLPIILASMVALDSEISGQKYPRMKSWIVTAANEFNPEDTVLKNKVIFCGMVVENLTPVDVRFWRIKTIPALKELTKIIKTRMMIFIRKKPFGLMVYIQIYQRCNW